LHNHQINIAVKVQIDLSDMGLVTILDDKKLESSGNHSENMHIVLFCPAWPPQRFASGIVTYVNHLRNELRDRGHKVTLLVGQLSPEDLSELDVVKVEASFLFELQTRLMFRLGHKHWGSCNWGRMIVRSLRKIHQQCAIDVVEMEESFGWCGLVASQSGIPTVVKLHGPTFLVSPLGPTPDDAKEQRIAREGQALAKVHTIISPAQCTLDQTIAHYGLRPKYAQQVVNSIVERADLPLWDADQCERNVVLFVGRFDEVKGADVVLKAFKLLLSRRDDLKLVFVGPDNGLPDERGHSLSFEPYLNQLFGPSQKAAITYLGRRSPPEIEKLRCEAFVTIVASRWENQPYTLLEAMLQGCPVVASNSGGIAEIVDHGKTGQLFECANPLALADSLETLIDHPQMAAEMGRLARQYVLEKHSLAAMTDATLLSYEYAISLAA